MNAHRSRPLSMAALVFILISLTAAVFHGAAPVRAEDVSTPAPIVIDGKTADVTVELFTDEGRKTPLDDNAVLSTNTLYGSFSAKFEANHGPSAERNVAEYSLPDSIKAFDNTGGRLMDDSNQEAGTWRCENNKLIFTFKESWIKTHPSDVHVGADFSFKLANENVGSGDTTKVKFPGTAEIDIATIDGDVTGAKEGKFSQSGSEGKVTWTLKLEVASYAHNVCLTDELGSNFSFVPGSFKLNDRELNPQPTINKQTANLNLGDLSKGTYTITYDSVMNPDVSVGNKVWINQLDDSKNNASWTWGGDRRGGLEKPGSANDFRYDMINKSDGTGTPSDITWTVTLNNGDIKTDMNGYTFTDTLDENQTYTGEYVVYKGLRGENKIADGNLDGSAGTTFSYTFSNLSEEDRYQPYRIVYHTKMNNLDSYEPVQNMAKIEHEETTLPSGTSTATFRRGIVEQLITKELESHDENGNATWITHVKIPETVDVSQVKILDTFKSTYLQHLKVESLAVQIGGKTLTEGTSTSGDYYFYTRDEVTKGNKINFNIQLRATGTVMRELRANGYQIDVVYTTVTDNLDGQYWNLAAVQFPFAGKDFKQYSSEPYYIVNNSKTPDVDKSSDGYTWDGKFDWSQVEPGSTEKGAWIATWTVCANRYKTPADEFYGAGKLDGQPITIKDTLPADGTMSFVPGSATYTLYANPYDERKEAEREVANQSVEGNVSGNEVTFSIPTTALGKYAGYAKLTYKTAIKRSVLNTSTNSTTLKNSASAESGSKTFGSGSGTVTIKNNVLQKTGDQVSNSNRIKYTILVNESAVNLKSGSDSLELVDVMDAKCTLVTDSVKVYQRNGTGWSLLSSNQYRVGAEAVPDQSGSTCTQMTLTVPDEEYLKVEYEIIPAGNTGEHVSLTNKASLKGVFGGDTGHTKDWEIQKLNGSAVGSGGGITVTKVDASDITKKLPGAEFTLYEVDMDKAMQSGVDGAMTEPPQKATTNSNGEAAFGSEGNKMKAYTLYCLKETTAPEGYTAISEPVWIMLKGQDEQQYKEALAKAERLKQVCAVVKTPTASTAIMVSDEPYSGQAVISATKTLEGSTLQEGQFGFVLKDKNTGRVLQTIRNGADGDINFVLDYTEMGTYEYTISEVIPEGADENNVKNHITYDTTEYEVTVTVTKGTGKLDTAVTYGGTDPTVPPTFTNKYSTTLPEAGGAGLTMTYLAGASLLCFAATWMHARRHRDRDRGGRRE
ncbi:Spy0128 family protein [Collinsella aerofaciens]|uniref:Spy0128 family protein n=1 Tax=Collinsella aerofaciens TaxID=74426 RepID=UPI0034A224C3